VQGGQVRLAPSPDTFYRIYGVRDKQVFSACAPDNPNRCRNWLLHRFDLDCGGVRVGWMKVVAAAARADRLAAWVDAGRMGLAMSPYWTIAREGPVYGNGWWRRSRFDGPDGPRGAAARRDEEVVILPPGFAPVLTTGARFLDGPAPEIARAPAAEPAHAPEKQEPLPPPVKKSEVVARAPTSVKENAAAGATSSTAAPPGDSASSSAAATVTAPGSTVTATIINKPGATTAAASPPAAAAPPTPEKAAPQPAAEPGEIATGSLQDAANRSSGTPVAVVGAATAALLLTATLLFWSRRRGSVRVTDLARDPARVSRGGLGRTGALTPLGPPPSVPAPAREPDGELAMPTTVDEALSVIGASADASLEVVKKIVDGLRQSWHPDLARSEADRLYRERRMAQINVAWDILSGRQVAE
jgi:hypothetical protein